MAAATTPPIRVVVVGAGLAGLACGLELARRGVAVTVVEADRAVGGRTKTVAVDLGLADGRLFPLDIGGLVVFPRYTHFERYLADFGLSHRLTRMTGKLAALYYIHGAPLRAGELASCRWRIMKAMLRCAFVRGWGVLLRLLRNARRDDITTCVLVQLALRFRG